MEFPLLRMRSILHFYLLWPHLHCFTMSYKQEVKDCKKKKKETNKLFEFESVNCGCSVAHGVLQSMQMLTVSVDWTVSVEDRGGGFHKWPQSPRS